MSKHHGESEALLGSGSGEAIDFEQGWLRPEVSSASHMEEQLTELFDLLQAPMCGYLMKLLGSLAVQALYGAVYVQQREAIQAYYASISFLDANVGRLLEALDRLKLTDNTVVIFWSDHGYLLGQHGQWMKQTVFEGSARAPMPLAGPGVDERARGKASARTVEFVDIYPTLADLCGLSGTPGDLAGRSLRPLLKNPSARWERPALTQVEHCPAGDRFMGYSVRDERWRYTEWDEGRRGAQLYDETKDAAELRNTRSFSCVRLMSF